MADANASVKWLAFPKNCNCLDSDSPLKPKIASLISVKPLAGSQQTVLWMFVVVVVVAMKVKVFF